MSDAPTEEPGTVALTARIEPELEAEILRIAAADLPRGAKPNKSQTVRVLLWDAVSRRPGKVV